MGDGKKSRKGSPTVVGGRREKEKSTEQKKVGYGGRT